jgi:hypothetical protein
MKLSFIRNVSDPLRIPPWKCVSDQDLFQLITFTLQLITYLYILSLAKCGFCNRLSTIW